MFLHKDFGPTEPPVLPAWPLLAWPVTIYWGVIKTKRPLMMVDPRPIINSTPPSLSKVWLDRSKSTRLDFFNFGSISNQYLGVLLFKVTTNKTSQSDFGSKLKRAASLMSRIYYWMAIKQTVDACLQQKSNFRKLKQIRKKLSCLFVWSI